MIRRPAEIIALEGVLASEFSLAHAPRRVSTPGVDTRQTEITERNLGLPTFAWANPCRLRRDSTRDLLPEAVNAREEIREFAALPLGDSLPNALWYLLRGRERTQPTALISTVTRTVH